MKKALGTLAFIDHCNEYMSQDVMLPLCKALPRPHLDTIYTSGYPFIGNMSFNWEQCKKDFQEYGKGGVNRLLALDFSV